MQKNYSHFLNALDNLQNIEYWQGNPSNTLNHDTFHFTAPKTEDDEDGISHILVFPVKNGVLLFEIGEMM